MYHLIPNDDLMPHHESITCPCNPRLMDGDDVEETYILHNAFDGRDFLEEEIEHGKSNSVYWCH